MREKLIGLQKTNEWTDAEMAGRLGVARSTWTEIKNGRLRVSEKVQIAAARAFPELLGELVTSVTVTRPIVPLEAL